MAGPEPRADDRADSRYGVHALRALRRQADVFDQPGRRGHAQAQRPDDTGPGQVPHIHRPRRLFWRYGGVGPATHPGFERNKGNRLDHAGHHLHAPAAVAILSDGRTGAFRSAASHTEFAEHALWHHSSPCYRAASTCCVRLLVIYTLGDATERRQSIHPARRS